MRFVFALISDILKSRSEVDTTGGKPIMLTARSPQTEMSAFGT